MSLLQEPADGAAIHQVVFFPGKGKPALHLLGAAPGYFQSLRETASRLPLTAQPGAIANAPGAAPLPPEAGRMSPSLFPDMRRSFWWGRVFGIEGKVSEGGKAAMRPRRFALTVRVLAGSPQGGRPCLTPSPPLWSVLGFCPPLGMEVLGA